MEGEGQEVPAASLVPGNASSAPFVGVEFEVYGQVQGRPEPTCPGIQKGFQLPSPLPKVTSETVLPPLPPHLHCQNLPVTPLRPSKIPLSLLVLNGSVINLRLRFPIQG